ncbi:phytoene desaturase family protein [Desertihabitans aurantiacus]|uniref:phytoene desaturase family protein n=1 Tax=Desertihabitans aurantiacus TaxID=2282477 RepID=UPI0018E52027|nr:NAD(P)/FAD-dependent oxidoreductase [Desertihabitans aurantiacus]
MSSSRAERGVVDVVGAGPNGLAAAIVLGRAGVRVRLWESADTPGGGSRSRELLEPGTWHDVCAAVLPGVLSSPFLRSLGLVDRLELVVPEVAYAQPVTGDRSVYAFTDLAATVEGLGRDGRGWQRVFGPLVERAEDVARLVGGNPLAAVTRPGLALRYGLPALRQWSPLPALRALTGSAADLFSGVAAHVHHRLDALSAPLTGLALATQAHGFGWPVVVGGSQRVVDVLVEEAHAVGVEITCGARITSLDQLPPRDAVLFATSVPELLRIGGTAVPGPYRALARRVRRGAAVGKVDLIVSEPIPWRDPGLRRASTIHLGGSAADLARAERDVARGRVPEHPVALVSAPTDHDPSRSASGHHVVWAYAHLPTGWSGDPTALVLAEIERWAPGFTDTVVASTARSAPAMERENPAYDGGDIYSGALTSQQALLRPVPALNPWRVGRSDLYLGSAAAAPGPGVHGMNGYHAARALLRHTYGRRGAALAGPAA